MRFFAVAAVVLVLGVSGCAKNEEMDPSQELMSLEDLSSMTVDETVNVTETDPLAAAKLEPLPPAAPYGKPTAHQIQQALKNAGFYTGNVDGKIGPMTKEAIEEFQKANNLEADGKVGPKTWQALGKYLDAASQQKTQTPAQ
jgi:peptidoglycan hydrolase-like protein with peptidoglycan-binding domain